MVEAGAPESSLKCDGNIGRERVKKFAALEVVTAFPDSLHGAIEDAEVFRRLAGAEIIRIGAPSKGDFEGGGLIIDYRLHGFAEIHRLILSFNELGMWVTWDSMEKRS